MALIYLRHSPWNSLEQWFSNILVSGPLYTLKKLLRIPVITYDRLYWYLPFQIKTQKLKNKKQKTKKHTSGQIIDAIPCDLACGKSHLTHPWARVKKANNMSIIMKISFILWTSVKEIFLTIIVLSRIGHWIACIFCVWTLAFVSGVMAFLNI